MSGWRVLGLIALLAVIPQAPAEVKSAGASGFVVEERVEIAASADEAFRALLSVARWWDPAHTYSGKAENLSVEARPGGCWCEALAGGGFVKHMELVALTPGRMLRFTGGLGPLLAIGATGTLSFAVLPRTGGGVSVTATYAVTGFQPEGFAALAAGVDAVLGGQLGRYGRLFGAASTPTTQP